MNEFAPPGYETLRQLLNARTSNLQTPEANETDEAGGPSVSASLRLETTARMHRDRLSLVLHEAERVRQQVHSELYTGRLSAYYVDPIDIQAGLKVIHRNYWATESGLKSIGHGRYYPLGEHLKSNPYIAGSEGSVFFVKKPISSGKPSDADGLPQKPGPKGIIEKVAAAYSVRWPYGHKDKGVKFRAALSLIRDDIGEGFSETTMRNAIKLVQSQ